MSPTLIGDTYAKDLSKLPSMPGGSFVSNILCFLLPDDIVMLRLTETTYDNADFDHIAVVEELSFHSPDFIEEEIERLRDEGLTDEGVVSQIISLDMIDDEASIVIARFAYDNFDFIDQNGNQAKGKQIRGAFVDDQKSRVGLAGHIYRQLVIMHQHLACDNTQTEFGAALWAATVRNVVGRVDIYNAALQRYVEELGDGGLGVNGCVPWNRGTITKFELTRWQSYPFHLAIQQCYYLVLIISA
ncbi:hypothetical protein [Dickeya dianthicola]|uniref:hypothetical protein n=1 Tax=Dickeya dianthicola TaxID=204039 RepID=UPI0003D79362|nr:hypothetical protein [Dickeya dianthicola]MCI4031469.1 hypothetical protein [Dickeya dianthicola]MCI4174605.1 hypothetical protein [Dickeya dianthicola]MCI4179535.1 hypothetical protein [Dickeya dianthicola]MCI4180358.1 hypothetical protein [Dickeya dianthicola]MCI4194043.1 hypothetical protein [Dickeya dianthicola]